MNFFDAKIVEKDNSLFIVCSAFEFKIPSDVNKVYKGMVGKEVVLGIRPEDIHDANYGPGGDKLAKTKAKADVLELMGNEILTYFSNGDHSFIGRIDPRSSFKYGEDVDVVFDLNGLQIFDKETELAIR